MSAGARPPEAGVSRRSLERTAACLAAVVLVAAACDVVRWRGRSIERGLERDGFAHHVEDVGGATVAYWDGGEGRVVVLLHGFGASGMWQWHGQADAFARRHRVIIPDLLWFGGSKPAGDDVSIDAQIRAILSLLDRLGVQSVDFVGSSYGGVVAYEIARREPSRVRRLVLADSPGGVYTRADYDALCARFGVADLGDLLVPSEPDGVARLLALGYLEPPWTPGFALESALDDLYGGNRAQLRGLLAWLVDHMEELAAIPGEPAAPALLVWGDRDEVFPPDIARRLAARLGPSTRTHVVASARHAPNLEHPDEFNAAVLGFLEED